MLRLSPSIALVVALLGAPARADLITYTFTGKVTSVDPALAGTFSAGQTLTGQYTFDPTTPPVAGSNSSFAVFDALTNLHFTLGSYSAASSAAPEIQVDNAPTAPDDRYAVVSRASQGLTGPSVNGLPLNFFAFRLDDSTGTVFSNALILPTSLNLSSFDSTAFFLFFGNTSPAIVSGTITSLTPVTAVPEPSSLALAGIGGLGLLVYRLRGRKTAARLSAAC
jgi:hypothetical protein